MPEPEKNIVLQGRTLSPGMGAGTTYIYRDIFNRLDEFYDIEEQDIQEENRRLDCAIRQTSEDLSLIASRVKKEIDSELCQVFHAHIAMVNDNSLRSEVEQLIEDDLVSAGTAIKTIFRRWERRFRTMDAQITRQKGDDIYDLARRLISVLAGVRSHQLETLPEGSIIVAHRLLPSDTVYLGRRNAAAAILEVGGSGSHAALFANEIGLPCVSGVQDALSRIDSGQPAFVDANTGRVLIAPDDEAIRQFYKKKKILLNAQKKEQRQAHRPAVTQDGKPINVMANIGCREDSKQAVAFGADGIGLYRVERTYLGCQEPPDREKLIDALSDTLEPVRHLPIFVRLLDTGADKTLPFLEPSKEGNPALGRRGIRFLQAFPEFLDNQLEALLYLSQTFDLSILVPMVTLPEDIRLVKERLQHMAASRPGQKLPRIGAMIETPAAALAADYLARHADFFSFGTNDLTQYSFAADRENESVDDYFIDHHDVIFRLMALTHQAAPDTPLSVCGELAARPEAISRLLQQQITSLSVAPMWIPKIKEAVRKATVDVQSDRLTTLLIPPYYPP